MRGTTRPQALFLLALCVAQEAFAQGGSRGVNLAPASPRHLQICTVTVRDSVSMNFACQSDRTTRQFWVAQSTRFVGRQPDASFFRLASGQRVEVTFHHSGRLAIADVVRF